MPRKLRKNMNAEAISKARLTPWLIAQRISLFYSQVLIHEIIGDWESGSTEMRFETI
jgi:hypothetical protein